MREVDTSAIGPEVQSDAWVSNVHEISSSYGQLVYLAALRDPDTGRYEYFGSDESGAPAIHMLLKKQHETIFRDWITMSLERKMADVQLYIASINRVDRAEILDAWLRLTPYKNLVPGAIQGPERRRHVSDFEAILGLLKNVYGVASPDPCA